MVDECKVGTPEQLAEAIQENSGYGVEFEIVTCKSKAEWLEKRTSFNLEGRIGASDAGTIAGCGFDTRMELYRRMRGETPPKDLSGNRNVQRGVMEEEHIRAMWSIENPEWEVWDGSNIIFLSKRYPWALASLDGVIRNRATGEWGILEIKSCNWSRKWSGIYAPDSYFIQNVHQSATTGIGRVHLHARLIGQDMLQEKEFVFLRNSFADQLEQLMLDEGHFAECVRSGNPPNAVIPNIF